MSLTLYQYTYTIFVARGSIQCDMSTDALSAEFVSYGHNMAQRTLSAHRKTEVPMFIRSLGDVKHCTEDPISRDFYFLTSRAGSSAVVSKQGLDTHIT